MLQKNIRAYFHPAVSRGRLNLPVYGLFVSPYLQNRYTIGTYQYLRIKAKVWKRKYCELKESGKSRKREFALNWIIDATVNQDSEELLIELLESHD